MTFTKNGYVEKKIEITVKPNDKDNGNISLEPMRPVLKVSTENLDFGTELITLPLDISNDGKGSLVWTIAYDEPIWFSVAPKSETTTNNISPVVVTVSRAGKARGIYTQTFIISSNGGSKTITVSMEVGGVALEIEPKELNFGSLTSSIQLTLSNQGTGNINYTVETPNAWILLDKKLGTIGSQKDYVTVNVVRESLSPGDYSGTITFKSGIESFIIPVKMEIAVNKKPEVAFDQVKNIAHNSAIFSGMMVSEGSSKVTRHGFCWSTSHEPVIDNNPNTINRGEWTYPASFENPVSNLTPNTTYFVRAYAQNSVGLSYSSEHEFITTSLPTFPVTGVTLNKNTATLTVGNTEQLTATVSPSNADNKTVTWSSSNTSVATVSSNGLITAKAAGTATIIVTTQDGNKTAQCVVTVNATTVSVTGVSLNKNTTTLSVGGTEQLTETISPSNATNKTVTWSSSNTNIATVSSSGLITANAAGNATITVTTQDGNKTAQCTVTVNATSVTVTGVSLNRDATTLTVGETEQLTATVSPSNATNKTVSWNSSNPAVVSVGSKGLITANAAGTATITVTTEDGNKTAQCVITVNEKVISVTNVTLNKTSINLSVNETEQLSANISPSNATNKKVTWSSSNTNIASVSSSGLITAKAIGKVTIAVTTEDGNKTATCAVNITLVKVGDQYQGGIVAYVDETGEHGIIAAPTDQSAGIGWGSKYIQDTQKEIGAGKSNTEAIVGVLGEGNYAAKICYDLVLNGYDDWFLPSINELGKLYQNRDAIGGFTSGDYWSSTESNDVGAYYIMFRYGNTYGATKPTSNRVRACRYF